MMTIIHCAKCIGIEAVPVTAEVDITSGLGIHLVGLADAAVKESLLRTITAMQSLGFRIPGRKIVINLAPADMHKKGSGYDVPIALGILASSGQHSLPLLEQYIIMGELGLDGSVRSIPGAIPIVEYAALHGYRGCILPRESAMETTDFQNIEVYGVDTLTDVIDILSGNADCSPMLAANLLERHAADGRPGKSVPEERGMFSRKAETTSSIPDFADIIGQEAAKRGIEIAAAGGHNIILIGPPGSGKSSLAKAMSGILPPMTLEESVQTSKIYSIAGRGNPSGGLIRQRPFRAPHYSASMAALIGGGSGSIMPGEISLAHNGVLFLDEFCEAPKKVLEALRGPMEDRHVTISRLKTKVEFPSDFMLAAAANPCPCGYYGEGDRCKCTPAQRLSYISKLSGPIMDRIDLQIWMHPIDARKLVERKKAESSAAVAERVLKAREIQKERFASSGIFCNAAMDNRMTDMFCRLDRRCSELLEKIIDRMGLSARACSRILKLSRTIADLEGAVEIAPGHIAEAVSYRFLDKM